MHPEVTLTLCDDLGRTRQLVVQSKRFTIGRTLENDLTIDNSSLSRRHAVIENFEGVVQISDCGSQNGTKVNGATIVASAILHSGDVISLAGVCEIEVSIEENGSEIHVAQTPTRGALQAKQEAKAQVSQRVGADERRGTNINGSGSLGSWLRTPNAHLVAVTAGILVILGAVGLLLFILNQTPRQHRLEDRPSTAQNSDSQDRRNASDTADNANTGSQGSHNESGTLTKETTASAKQVENAAAGVMRRISSDDKAYSFSEKALHDIDLKVNQYRASSSLVGNLSAIQRNGADLGALARRGGIEPGLLIYVVLAEAEIGRANGEPKVLANGIITDLLALRATFGTNDADSSLLIVAAYKVKRGEGHPDLLLATIRRLVKNPLTQRNVWYLNEHGGLEPAVYDFVVSFLALGAIAQDPSQFGVGAAPLVF
jgi:hypothetical protein